VLRKVAGDADLAAAERNTNYGGYNFWLGKLDDNGGDYHRAQMVFAFIDSVEYRRRFAP
jgi:hypothetical protein